MAFRPQEVLLQIWHKFTFGGSSITKVTTEKLARLTNMEALVHNVAILSAQKNTSNIFSDELIIHLLPQSLSTTPLAFSSLQLGAPSSSSVENCSHFSEPAVKNGRTTFVHLNMAQVPHNLALKLSNSVCRKWHQLSQSNSWEQKRTCFYCMPQMLNQYDTIYYLHWKTDRQAASLI